MWQIWRNSGWSSTMHSQQQERWVPGQILLMQRLCQQQQQLLLQPAGGMVLHPRQQLTSRLQQWVATTKAHRTATVAGSQRQHLWLPAALSSLQQQRHRQQQLLAATSTQQQQ
jgi:hypothetical protein